MLYRLADNAEALGRPEEALHWLDEQYSLHPEDPDSLDGIALTRTREPLCSRPEEASNLAGADVRTDLRKVHARWPSVMDPVSCRLILRERR